MKWWLSATNVRHGRMEVSDSVMMLSAGETTPDFPATKRSGGAAKAALCAMERRASGISWNGSTKSQSCTAEFRVSGRRKRSFGMARMSRYKMSWYGKMLNWNRAMLKWRRSILKWNGKMLKWNDKMLKWNGSPGSRRARTKVASPSAGGSASPKTMAQ